MSVPEEGKQSCQHEVTYVKKNDRIYEGALIVLLLVIMGLLLRVSFKTSTPIANDSTQLALELARLRLQVAKNEELMMRFFEQGSFDQPKQDAFDMKAIYDVVKQLKKLNSDVLARDQELMKELSAIKMKLKESSNFTQDFATSMEELKGYMTSLLTKIKNLGSWFN